MATLSREQLQNARLQARVKRQEEIDSKHAEIAQVKSEGGDTAALERELEKLYDDYNERRNARREAKKAARELRDTIQAGIGRKPALRWNTSDGDVRRERASKRFVKQK